MKTKIYFLNKRYALLMLFLALESCAVLDTTQNKSVLGLYRVSERVCKVPEAYKNDCEATRFVELVKGQFYGVANNEIAFVNWQGSEGEALSYQARNISKKNKSINSQDMILISKTKTENEFLTVKNGIVVEYVFKINNPLSKVGAREYRYTLIPANRSDTPENRMNYPGND